MRTMIKGTVEFLEIELTADVELTTQPVRISLDRTTWQPADWVGPTGLVRQARLLVDTADMACGIYPVHVRVTDNPEAPVLYAGGLQVT